MPKRGRLKPEEKLRLLHAYKYQCAICGELLPPTVEIDHITPLGSWLWRHIDDVDPNHYRNLQPLCPGCHAFKSQGERINRPVKSEYKCACGDVHSTYFEPRCEPLRAQILEIRLRCGALDKGIF